MKNVEPDQLEVPFCLYSFWCRKWTWSNNKSSKRSNKNGQRGPMESRKIIAVLSKARGKVQKYEIIGRKNTNQIKNLKRSSFMSCKNKKEDRLSIKLLFLKTFWEWTKTPSKNYHKAKLLSVQNPIAKVQWKPMIYRDLPILRNVCTPYATIASETIFGITM